MSNEFDDAEFDPSDLEPTQGQSGQSGTKKGLSFIRAIDAIANANKPIPWLIDGFLIKDTLVGLVGKPSSGKSLIALSMASCVATGADWFGHKTQKGAVFYVAGEGQWGISRRLKAWSNHTGIGLNDASLFLSDQSVILNNPASVTEMIATIKDTDEEPAMIVIDTLQRSFQGDENSASDMASFISNCDFIRKTFQDCIILLVHHSGHTQDRARGSSAFHASLDTSYLVNDDSGIRRMTQTKTKDGKPADEMAFEVVEVSIFDNEQSVTIDKTQAYSVASKKLTQSMKLGIQTFFDVATKGHLENEDLWRDQFFEKHTGNTSDTKRKAFSRVKSDLVNEGILSVKNNTYQANDFSGYPEANVIRAKANFPKPQNEPNNEEN